MGRCTHLSLPGSGGTKCHVKLKALVVIWKLSLGFGSVFCLCTSIYWDLWCKESFKVQPYLWESPLFFPTPPLVETGQGRAAVQGWGNSSSTSRKQLCPFGSKLSGMLQAQFWFVSGVSWAMCRLLRYFFTRRASVLFFPCLFHLTCHVPLSEGDFRGKQQNLFTP